MAIRRSLASLTSVVGPIKRSTGIVGLDVDPNGRETLQTLLKKMQDDVKIIPEGVYYRSAVESIANYRLGVCEKFEDIAAIEDEIGCGQIEELIEQAQDELRLIPNYAEWREWEDPVATEDDDPLPFIGTPQ